MKNIIFKAYENCKELLKKSGIRQKEENYVSKDFDDMLVFLTSIEKEGDFYNFIGVFDSDDGEMLCIGDELVPMTDKDIYDLSCSNDPKIIIDLCKKYDQDIQFNLK